MIRFIEAIPITLFLAYIRRIDTQVPENFKGPFTISAAAAVLLICILVYKKQPLNRLFLGINLYLISGGAAFITHQYWLNRIYDDLQASGMLLWIIGVGVVTTLLSPRGFINTASSDKKRVKTKSLFLLLFASIAFAVAFLFRTNKLFPEFVPFVCLFLLQNHTEDKLNKTGNWNGKA